MFTRKIDENVSLALSMPEDAEKVTAVVLANLEHLRPWMPWAKDDYSVETARWFIQRSLKTLAETGQISCAIMYNGEFAGVVGFHDLNKADRSALLGYWISKEYEGRGIVTRCCRVLINYLFGTMNLNRIQINCNIENTRSRAIPERLGFKLEGIARQAERLEDRFGDWAVYSMLAKEWNSDED